MNKLTTHLVTENRVITVAAVETDTHYSFGVAIQNPEDKFSKSKGETIALGRAEVGRSGTMKKKLITDATTMMLAIARGVESNIKMNVRPFIKKQ